MKKSEFAEVEFNINLNKAAEFLGNLGDFNRRFITIERSPVDMDKDLPQYKNSINAIEIIDEEDRIIKNYLTFIRDPCGPQEYDNWTFSSTCQLTPRSMKKVIEEKEKQPQTKDLLIHAQINQERCSTYEARIINLDKNLIELKHLTNYDYNKYIIEVPAEILQRVYTNKVSYYVWMTIDTFNHQVNFYKKMYEPNCGKDINSCLHEGMGYIIGKNDPTFTTINKSKTSNIIENKINIVDKSTQTEWDLNIDLDKSQSFSMIQESVKQKNAAIKNCVDEFNNKLTNIMSSFQDLQLSDNSFQVAVTEEHKESDILGAPSQFDSLE